MREGQMVLHHLADLIGLNLLPINELVAPPDVMRLVEDRAEARRSKDRAKSDPAVEPGIPICKPDAFFEKCVDDRRLGT